MESSPGIEAATPPRPCCAELQRFDERHLDLVAGQVDAVAFVLESHIPALLAWLRPHEDAQEVIASLWNAVEICAAHEIRLEVTVPFFAENASSLPETVAALVAGGVRHVRVVPARAAPGRPLPVDPFACFSARYVQRIRMLCEEAANVEDSRFVWEPREGASFEVRGLPGFCEEAWGRVSVRAGGRVAPCIYAPDGDLELGDLATSPMGDIWHGRESLDLRRAHLTWDYPGACTSCPRTATQRTSPGLEFMQRFAAQRAGAGEDQPVALEAVSPGPVARRADSPMIVLARPPCAVRSWHLAWSRAGAEEATEDLALLPAGSGGPFVSLPLPGAAWEDMTPNLGYWWAVFAKLEDGGWAVTRDARCLISHEPLARADAGLLRYPGDPRRELPSPSVLSPALGGDEYDDLVARVREAVRTVVPEGAIAAVVSKGDERLSDFGEVQGWHFPRSEDGVFAGFHPPDGEWAVRHLKALQAAGAGYFVVPATAAWWYDQYPQLAAYMREHCALVLEERETCVVVALEEKGGP